MANRRMINRADIELPGWLKLPTKQKLLYWVATLLTDDDGIASLHLVDREFPDDRIAQEDIVALEDLSLVHYYEHDGYSYMQIMFWWDKQFIDKKMYVSSKMPKCKYYLRRPENMNQKKKEGKWTLYDERGMVLEQYKEREDKPVKGNQYQVSGVEVKEKHPKIEVSRSWADISDNSK